MSDGVIVIEGVEVAFERLPDDGFLVLADGREIGRVDLVSGGSGLVASRPDGARITRKSQWGGDVTARFASRELAARALLAG